MYVLLICVCYQVATEDRGKSKADVKLVPRAVASEQSPHPRAAQEARFKLIALEWHQWVTVPEHVGKEPFSRELLQLGVALPVKHCFWKGCSWTGKTNVDRWRHVRKSHWSPTTQAAVEYYHEDLHENVCLEAVLNQVASIIVRTGAPLAGPAIDRRCLRNL